MISCEGLLNKDNDSLFILIAVISPCILWYLYFTATWKFSHQTSFFGKPTFYAYNLFVSFLVVASSTLGSLSYRNGFLNSFFLLIIGSNLSANLKFLFTYSQTISLLHLNKTWTIIALEHLPKDLWNIVPTFYAYNLFVSFLVVF